MANPSSLLELASGPEKSPQETLSLYTHLASSGATFSPEIITALIRSDNLNLLHVLHQGGVTVDFLRTLNQDKFYYFLAEAATKNRIRILRFWRETGLTLDDVRASEALRSASVSGRFDIIRYLVDEMGMTLEDVRVSRTLQSAIIQSRLDIIRYLVEIGITLEDVKDNVILEYAINNRHLDVIRYFIEELGLTVEDVKNSGALRSAAADGHLNIIRYLVGVGLTLKDMKDSGVLRFAAKGGHLNIIRYLVEVGLTLKDMKDSDVLRFAAKGGHLDIIRYLVGMGLTLEDLRASNALQSAAYYGHLDIIRYLVDEMGLTLEDLKASYILVDALVNGQLDIIRYLVEIGMTLGDLRASRALRTAVNNGWPNIVRYLVGIGMTLNDVKDSGALRSAIIYGWLDFIHYFVEMGLTLEDIRADDFGLFRLAIFNDRVDVAEYFMDKMGLTELPDNLFTDQDIATLSEETLEFLYTNGIIWGVAGPLDPPVETEEPPLTAEQVRKKIQNTSRPVSRQECPRNRHCPICRDSFLTHRRKGGVTATTLFRLQCKHLFHHSCINAFLAESAGHCPLCSTVARDEGSHLIEIPGRTTVQEACKTLEFDF